MLNGNDNRWILMFFFVSLSTLALFFSRTIKGSAFRQELLLTGPESCQSAKIKQNFKASKSVRCFIL